ncbi:hypothetical protein EDC04DRAFT_2990027 [Pisolithus marmoratus]|nr:hypothetical protein EDC04DRAFT_2990027 [Pisolithus marmoratus]
MAPFFSLTTIHDNLLVVTCSITLLDIAAVIAAIWALCSALRAAWRTFKTTKLHRLPRTDLIFGAAKQIFKSPDAGAIYEAWVKEYGVAYEVLTTLGGKKIVLTDLRALAHYYAKETWTYVQTASARSFIQHHICTIASF